MINYKIIDKLKKAYDIGLGEVQEKACITAIKEILDDENTNQCEFLINLRDFLLDYMDYSPEQRRALENPCPNCEIGKLRKVSGTEDDKENYLWCDNCDLSMDSSGGYIA